jgi:hypothetical protein
MSRIDAARLPWSDMPSSFRVDLLQLLSGSRPAVRSHVAEPALEKLRMWCTASGLDFAAEGPWVSVSTLVGRAAQVLEVDASPAPHEVDLGLLLGYPRCCCDQAALVGESNIDDYARSVAAWPLNDEYALLDISRYDEGVAIISHVPCSPDCEPSRILAQKSVAWLDGQACASEPFLSWLATVSLLARGTRPRLGSRVAPSTEA